MAAVTGLCQASDSCLLIIDVQTRLTAAMPAKVLDRLLRNATLLIKSAAMLSVPVLATHQYPRGLGPLEPQIAGVLPPDCRHFEKTSFSCTGAENFSPALQAQGRKQVVIAGIEAHVCVLQTALDLYEANYQVFVVADAISSRARENYENALQRLQQAGISICNTESVIFEWLRDARHEQFKEIAALVK